jgi:hypothetical protein
MLKNTQKLPSMEEFKVESKKLRISQNFEKLGHAQNSLAQKYGFKNYNSIKPMLIEKDALFNRLSNKINTYKLSTGAIVNIQGLYKTKNDYATDATISKYSIPRFEIEKALYFIDNVLEKRKTVNPDYDSYVLKDYAEKYIKHYKLFGREYYISNGAFIIALDIRGYIIKEIDDHKYYSLNIKTNYKSFRENFDNKLKNGGFDYTVKPNNSLPILESILQLKENNFTNSKTIPSHHFDILENRNTAQAFFQYLSIFIYHMIKAMNSQTETMFYFEISKNELENKFSYLTYDNKDIIKTIKKDLILTNQLLGINPNIFYDSTLKSFVIYWDKKDTLIIETPKNHNTKSYLEYDTFFHKFENNKLEYQGIIQRMDENNIYVSYDYLDDKIYEIPLTDLDNYIFYHSKKFRDNVHKLVNEASKIEKHQFFSQDKKGYLLAKKFTFDYEETSNFILKDICGYNLDTI